MTNTYTVQLDENPQALLQELRLQIKKNSKSIPIEIREQLPLNINRGTIIYAALLLLQKEVQKCQIETEKDQDNEVLGQVNEKAEENKEIVNSHGPFWDGDSVTGTLSSPHTSPSPTLMKEEGTQIQKVSFPSSLQLK